MKIVVVHRDPVPSKILPSTGSSIRLEQITMALQNAGHEVHLCQYIPHSNHEHHVSTPNQFISFLQEKTFDMLLFLQVEDVTLCTYITDVPRDIKPFIVVDLYAQRLLEASFSGHLDRDTPYILETLRLGDCFLTSNERQRWSWMSLLALAGVDLHSPPLITVPLMAPTTLDSTKQENHDFILIGGGIWWPWQNPTHGIEQVLDVLDEEDCGEIHWYGKPHSECNSHHLPHHKRLIVKEQVSLHTYRNALIQATLALDWMENNGEREMAISFRQMEYIGAGLPILTYPSAMLASIVRDTCWPTNDIKELVRKLIHNPHIVKEKRIATQKAKQLFSLNKTTKDFLNWCKDPRYAKKTSVRITERNQIEIRAQELEQKIIGFEYEIRVLEQDIQKKDLEIQQLQDDNAQLLSSVERLAIAMENTASFKGERSKEKLQQCNATLQADNAKKTAELKAMDALRVRLENDLKNLRLELLNAKKRRFF